MKQKHIQVDEAALEQTVLLCQKEQERYIQKNCTSILQLILRYMWLDFRFYMILSILGLFTSILLIPVSYTHLDVYKRQASIFPSRAIKRSPCVGALPALPYSK